MKVSKEVKYFSKSIITKILVVVLSFINSILINRYLGVALRGEYTLILNSANFIQLVLNLGIGNAYSAFVRMDIQNVKEKFSRIILIQLILFFCISLLFFAFLSVNNKYTLILSIMMILESQILFISNIEDTLKRNKIQIVIAIMYTALLFLMFIITKRSLEILLVVVILSHFATAFLLFLKFKMYKLKNSQVRLCFLKEVLKMGIPIMIMNLLMFCNYHIDIFILKAITNNNYNIGLYGTAVTLGNMIWIIPDAFKDILYNRSAKSDNVTEIILSITINIVICVVSIFMFFFFGKFFLIKMYGEDFSDAYALVLLLFIGTIPMIFYKLIHPIYITNKQVNIVVVILLISVLLNIILNFVLIPNYGAIGAAIASVFSYTLCGFIFCYKFKKDYNVKFSKIINNYISKRKD